MSLGQHRSISPSPSHLNLCQRHVLFILIQDWQFRVDDAPYVAFFQLSGDRRCLHKRGVIDALHVLQPIGVRCRCNLCRSARVCNGSHQERKAELARLPSGPENAQSTMQKILLIWLDKKGHEEATCAAHWAFHAQSCQSGQTEEEARPYDGHY